MGSKRLRHNWATEQQQSSHHLYDIYDIIYVHRVFPDSSAGKKSTCNAGDLGLIPGQEDPREKETATHSSILAWEIPRAAEPGGPQSMGSQRVRHDRVQHACIYTHPQSTIMCNYIYIHTHIYIYIRSRRLKTIPLVNFECWQAGGTLFSLHIYIFWSKGEKSVLTHQNPFFQVTLSTLALVAMQEISDLPQRSYLIWEHDKAPPNVQHKPSQSTVWTTWRFHTLALRHEPHPFWSTLYIVVCYFHQCFPLHPQKTPLKHVLFSFWGKDVKTTDLLSLVGSVLLTDILPPPHKCHQWIFSYFFLCRFFCVLVKLSEVT